ncbi:hypothetical protein LX36DRAFT_701820 [Colletotrichum falcatum]|nr:hypothetical protein LX36DRAFT_701820 [Colletotrichum falcatum]
MWRGRWLLWPMGFVAEREADDAKGEALTSTPSKKHESFMPIGKRRERQHPSVQRQGHYRSRNDPVRLSKHPELPTGGSSKGGRVIGKMPAGTPSKRRRMKTMAGGHPGRHRADHTPDGTTKHGRAKDMAVETWPELSTEPPSMA